MTKFSPKLGSELTNEDKYYSILLIGPPGCGKTTMMLTDPNELFVLDIDGKLHQIAAAVDLSKVSFQQFEGSLWGLETGKLVSTIKKVNPKLPSEGMVTGANPKTFLDVVDVINELAEIVKKDGKLPFKTLGFDSYSRFSLHLEAYIQAQISHTYLTQTDWGVVAKNHVAVVEGITSPRFPCNVVMTCHSKTMVDEITKEVTIVPDINGGFSHKIGGYFQEVYFLIPEISKGRMNVKAMTRADGKYALRSSLTDLVEVNADIAAIVRGDFRGEKAEAYFAVNKPQQTGRVVKETLHQPVIAA